MPAFLLRFSQPALVLISLAFSAALYAAEWRQALLWLTGVTVIRLLRHRRLIPLWMAVVGSLVPLFAVKLSMTFGIGLLGLSFATFRAIDVLVSEREKDPLSPLVYLVYLTFPPVLITGPMLRWRDFVADFQAWPQGWNRELAGQGASMLALGVFQKFFCADVIRDFVLSALPLNDSRPEMIAANALAYAAFLYFDFAGYSNMMVGVCGIIGFRCPVNFRNPVLASDPRDFWRRWHVSLSEWLRDMVFFPLYRSLLRRIWFRQHPILTQSLATFVTLFLMGTWNGLKPQYVVSGILFGLMSVAQVVLGAFCQRIDWLGRFSTSVAGRLLVRVLTLLGVLTALYIFSGRGPV